MYYPPLFLFEQSVAYFILHFGIHWLLYLRNVICSKVRSALKYISFLWLGVVSPTLNPQAGGPPLVGCPPLLIQYIRSYPPYLEDFSSIRNLRTRHAMVTKDPTNMANFTVWVQNLVLTLREEHRLRVFENRVLRRIFGGRRIVKKFA
jgi:hypothetical protein